LAGDIEKAHVAVIGSQRLPTGVSINIAAGRPLCRAFDKEDD